MSPEQYLGIECPFCGAEFHRDREAAGRPCIVHPTSMETGKPCLLDGHIWIALKGDLGPLLLKISDRSEKIREWMEAWNRENASTRKALPQMAPTQTQQRSGHNK